MARQPAIQGFLIDLDGTIMEADSAIPGASQTLEWLKTNGLPYCFVSNTTSKPRKEILAKIQALGIEILAEELFTAPIIAREYLLNQGVTRCFSLIKESLQEDLAGIQRVEVNPQAVLIGDIGHELTYAKMNHAFRLILDGALFIALARNRYFRGQDGLCLDVGSIVAALEYATQREAILIGKPASEFFRVAARKLGIAPENIAVIGDDLEADVGGGKQAGGSGILVRTGKFRPEQLEKIPILPDAILDSIANLPEWWNTRQAG